MERYGDDGSTDPIGRNTYGDLDLWSGDHVVKLARIADFLRSHPSVPAVQLHHAGSKSSRQHPWKALGQLGEAVFYGRGSR